MKVLVTENCAGLLLIGIKLEQNLVPPLNVVVVVFLQMILMATLTGKNNQWNKCCRCRQTVTYAGPVS